MGALNRAATGWPAGRRAGNLSFTRYRVFEGHATLTTPSLDSSACPVHTPAAQPKTTSIRDDIALSFDQTTRHRQPQRDLSSGAMPRLEASLTVQSDTVTATRGERHVLAPQLMLSRRGIGPRRAADVTGSRGVPPGRKRSQTMDRGAAQHSGRLRHHMPLGSLQRTRMSRQPPRRGSRRPTRRSKEGDVATSASVPWGHKAIAFTL